MIKVISVLMAIGTALMSLFAGCNDIKAPVDESDFVPVLRFVVASDSHVGTLGDMSSRRLQKVMSLAYDDAKADENYKTVDALLFEGDLTDDGNAMQIANFYATVKSCIKEETQFHAVIPKSHDGYKYGKSVIGMHEEIFGTGANYHVTINGIHFIGVSTTENDADKAFDDSSIEYLETELAKASEENPNAPIIVSTHEHITDTVYGSREIDGWGQETLRPTLEKYPQVISFSGHSHYPTNDPRSIWQGEFTAVGTGALRYAEFTVDTDRKVHPSGYQDMAQCWIVEIDKDNNVRLRTFDANSGTLLCEYILKDIANPDARQYTPKQREEASSAPEFADGASLKVSKIAGKYKVKAPSSSSTDGSPIFVYRFIVLDKDGNEKSSSYVVNDYWRVPVMTSVSKSVKASKGDTIQVIAENAYGKQSAPLTYNP